jgi:hypothetical protein
MPSTRSATGKSSPAKRVLEQADLYQLVSYALRLACSRAVLLYPAADGKIPAEPQQYTVSSELMPADKIALWAASIPVSGAVDDEETLVAQLESSLRKLLRKGFKRLTDM